MPINEVEQGYNNLDILSLMDRHTVVEEYIWELLGTKQ